MKLLRVLALCGLVLGMISSEVGAAEPTKEDIARAEMRATVLAELALSAELAHFGRDAKSPESLVIAGGMLIRAKKTFGQDATALEGAPTDEKGKAVTVEKAIPLDKQAEALFDEARALVAGDKTRSLALETTIKGAMTFGREGNAESRGACGGPRQINCTLEPGQSHTFYFSFVSGVPASVCLTGNGPPPLQFDLVRLGDNATIYSNRGRTSNFNWNVGATKEGFRKFSITVKNVGVRSTTYRFTTN